MTTIGLRRLSVALCVLLVCSSCSRPARDSRNIKITGSDTMVNLAQAWQERYQKVQPAVAIQVTGGGSGVGIAALCGGKVDIAPSSRKIKPNELKLAQERTGKEPKEYVVGLDALAIYVHPDNPLDTITIPQLAELYGANGTITRWDDLKVDNAACSDGEIIRVSRQNSSGTYLYFKEAVLGENRDFKEGMTSQSGSSDVVALVSKTPCAIGYSGMGYRTDEVKVVKVAKKEGEPGVEPSKEAAIDGRYPISRPLFLYTLGEPEGYVKEFIDWVMSDEGQQLVEDLGYVRIPKDYGTKTRGAE